MAILYSNELKAVVVADGLQGNMQNVLKEKCMTVQHFDYHCEYNRNQNGEHFGSQQPALLNFSIRVSSMSQASVFYKNLVGTGNFEYTFLFNPHFGSNMRLSTYEDGMIIDGYVISVEENYNSAKNKEDRDEQVVLDIKILIRNVLYLGRDEYSNLRSVFIQ